MDLPDKQRVVGTKWIFKRKEGLQDGESVMFKVRLVAMGYSFVVKHCLIIILLAIITQFDLELEQLDVKSVFLHGDLEETIYM